MTNNKDQKSGTEEDEKQSNPQSELEEALTKAGLGKYAEALDKMEFKTFKDLGNNEEEVKKSLHKIKEITDGAVNRIARLWKEATTPKKKHKPVEAPEIPDGKPLDLTQESVKINDVEFHIPTELPAPGEKGEVIVATDLNRENWLTIARNNELLYAVDLEKAFSSSPDDRRGEPSAMRAAALWQFPDKGDSRRFYDVKDEANSETTMSYTMRRQSLVHSRVTEAAVHVSAPFVGISASVSHAEKQSESQAKKKLYLTGRWYLPRAVLHLGQCLVASKRFKKAIDDALKKPDRNSQFQALRAVFREYGHVYPRKVTIGGMMYFEKEHETTAKKEERESELEVKAAVKAAYGPISGGASGGHKRGDKEGHEGQETSEQVHWTCVGGDTTLNERIADWSDSVKVPKLWRVIQRSDLMSVTELLDNDRKEKVEDVWNEGLKTLWSGQNPPDGHVFPPFQGNPFMIAGGPETSSPVLSSRVRLGPNHASTCLPVINHGFDDPFAEECAWQLIYTGETTSIGDPLFWIVKFDPDNVEAISRGELKNIRVPAMCPRKIPQIDVNYPILGFCASDEAFGNPKWKAAKWAVTHSRKGGKDTFFIRTENVTNNHTQDGYLILGPVEENGCIITDPASRLKESPEPFCKALKWSGINDQLVSDWHTAKLKQGVHFKGLEMYTLKGNSFEYTDGLETLGDSLWFHECYFQTIRTETIDDQLYALARGPAGVELYEHRKTWTINLGTCRRFKDPGQRKVGWNLPQYYSTIQTAVVNDTLYLLGRGTNGVELYRWNSKQRQWSDNLGTCGRFKDPEKGKFGWDSPQYYSTIQTAVVDDTLFLLGRGAGGMELYRWNSEQRQWSDNLGTCGRFRDPEKGKIGWNSPQYYSTIQTAVVDDTLFLLGRGAGGMELYRWNSEQEQWSGNLGTCEKFSDAKGWGNPDNPGEKHEFYSTIQTAMIGETLYLLGRGVGGVKLFKWAGSDWSYLDVTNGFSDSGGWGKGKPEHYSTIQTEVVNDTLYLLGRGAEAVYLYRFNQKNEEWKHISKYPHFTNDKDLGIHPSVYSTIQTITHNGKLTLLGRTPAST